MPYQHEIKVEKQDIDLMGHVNNVVYVRYVQEVAEAHWKSIATQAEQESILWVVLRHELDYKNPAFEGEILSTKTWVEPAEGVRLPRIVTIQNQKGKEIVRARTTWCPIDAHNQRPLRIDQKLYQRFE